MRKAIKTNQSRNKSHVLSIRLKAQQMEPLQRFARQLGRSTSEVAAVLIEEGLRRLEFAHIDFRNTLTGRQAYVMGTSLAVWEVTGLARDYSRDLNRIASHLDWPEFRVQAALNYADAYPEEIHNCLADNASYDFVKLSRLLPQTQLFVAESVNDSANAAPLKSKRISKKPRA